MFAVTSTVLTLYIPTEATSVYTRKLGLAIPDYKFHFYTPFVWVTDAVIKFPVILSAFNYVSVNIVNYFTHPDWGFGYPDCGFSLLFHQL